ncbi:molybdenum ABC transporter permease subunit [Leucobacter massiliensis]|uniref:Molybdenum transport system permease n=1 Tax=Leucobacter massiliensis TaxID=1686285 RepID=A0A2S9QP13_9MICO|nr:molybdenum ABC transporter permease subunit [Leucobacter massiliensis]
MPRAVLLPAALAATLLLLPLAALLLRVDWALVPTTLASPEALSALGLSLGTAAVATLLCLLLGVPLALVISRASGALATVLRALTTLPLVLPPLVGGLALLSLLGRGGLLGDALAGLGVRVPFTTAAVIIAQTFVSLPFLVIAVEGALRGLDGAYERTAESLGAGPWTVLRRVTLPLLAPSLAAGTILCFTRALGEFGATALFAGNSPGTTRTVPLAIYTAFNGAGVSQDTALALSLLLVLLAVAALLCLRSRSPQAAAS